MAREKLFQQNIKKSGLRSARSDSRLPPASSGSTDRLRSFLRQAPFAVQIHSPDGLLREVNRAWEEVWGITADQVVDKFNILENPHARALGIHSIFSRALAGKATRIKEQELDPADFGHPGRRSVPGSSRCSMRKMSSGRL